MFLWWRQIYILLSITAVQALGILIHSSKLRIEGDHSLFAKELMTGD